MDLTNIVRLRTFCFSFCVCVFFSKLVCLPCTPRIRFVVLFSSLYFAALCFFLSLTLLCSFYFPFSFNYIQSFACHEIGDTELLKFYVNIMEILKRDFLHAISSWEIWIVKIPSFSFFFFFIFCCSHFDFMCIFFCVVISHSLHIWIHENENDSKIPKSRKIPKNTRYFNTDFSTLSNRTKSSNNTLKTLQCVSIIVLLYMKATKLTLTFRLSWFIFALL